MRVRESERVREWEREREGGGRRKEGRRKDGGAQGKQEPHTLDVWKKDNSCGVLSIE